ncbi:valine--tRNA ligase [Candidatus Microgenomates bacterium]|nr:valine--tRNA ligase [Candidatus Microgenomates bacterium]
MDKVYNANTIEDKWYQLWEKAGYFTPKIDKDKKALPAGRQAFSILLPLPNANDPMHMGHALFTIQDIMIRYHRMLGDPTLWLPGADHAGIETQFVFEKHLAKQGKSRFDFDRSTLYKLIWEFVEKNRAINRDQLKKLGFSLDWTRYHYSLEPEIVEKVMETFKKLHQDGLIYRGERIVNFCTKCGTAFSDLEIEYVERKDPLYYIKYGPFILATTRPETKFGDTAVAFHPGDKRYMKYLGQEIEIRGVNGPFKVKVVADEAIDPKFGTGIEKVTPGHDAMDFEIGQRHNLPIKKVINLNGRLNELAGKFAGMKVAEGRKAVFAAMEVLGLIDHVDENYLHNVATCYRCHTTIEPMVIPQWFIKMKPLAKAAIDAVKTGRTKIVPKKRFEKMYFDWLKNIRDWNISRQIVWGPRIPVWYCLNCNGEIKINFINKQSERINDTYRHLKDKYTFEEINAGLQSMMADKEASYQLSDGKCLKCHGTNILQETDTFDTWFLSGQWPLTTLGADFQYFYPTSVLDTLWDILFFWVAKMMILGLYVTGEVPFKVIHLHARVVDKFGQKMSKSKGNVIDPLEITQKYGADALRFALVMGVAPASDICLSEEKIVGMRNFTNKLWNIGRFIRMNMDAYKEQNISLTDFKNIKNTLKTEDKKISKYLDKLTKDVTKSIDNYHFGRAAEDLYTFIWHTLADKHLELVKDRLKNMDKKALVTLIHIYTTSLKLLHPFMPFITEEINQQINLWDSTPLIISPWPEN